METNSEFAYKMLIFAIVIMLAMPIMINNFVPTKAIDVDQEELLEDYYSFTGASKGHTKESVWVLTGMYTPYEGTTYGYTDDGWVYGQRIQNATPSQYEGTPQEFSVYRDDNGIYRYRYDTADYDADKGTGHRGTYYKATQEDVDAGKAQQVGQDIKRSEPGEYYTSIVFDLDQRSNIFFNPNTKYNQNGEPYDSSIGGDHFYYQFTGLRYAFQPVADSWTADGDGNKIRITATTTSLSLIWYVYYTQSGISGQLVLSGNDSGVAFINGDQILSKFDSTTSTARFNMTFNGGVQMGIYIRMDPMALQDRTVKECYDLGYWSLMVTSLSTDSEAYTGTDFSLNIFDLFDTLIKLMTFDYHSFGMSDMMGAVCSFTIIIPLYAGLISLALGSWEALILTGIVAAIQSIATMITNWKWSLWTLDPDTLTSMLIHALQVLGLS